MSHSIHEFQEITVAQARERANQWQQDGSRWHFYALFPNCVLNAPSNRHTLVLEDCSSHNTYAIYSDHNFVDLSQELLRLHYGEDILKEPDIEVAASNSPNQLLDLVDTFNKNSIAWHHHILLPDCVFNDRPNKWKILLEGGGGQHNFYELYEEEPLEVLQLLEIEYFKKLDPTFCSKLQRKDP